ncbi:MAG TPA: helix-turn-helix transcriptional regulator [Chloroflexota bacterium]|jgi:transcriptional regulator with XRE-family HTH domain
MRERYGLTVQALAEKAGVPIRAILLIESGRATPGPPIPYFIARALNADYQWIDELHGRPPGFYPYQEEQRGSGDDWLPSGVPRRPRPSLLAGAAEALVPIADEVL